MVLGVLGCGTVTGGTAGPDGDAGEIIACESNVDCPDTSPICDTTSKTCRGCAENSECSDDPSASLCNPTSGSCVQCYENSQCTSSTSNICDTEDLVCRGCQEHDECASGFCDKSRATCVALGDIVFVDGDETPAAQCGDFNRPCATIAAGISALDYYDQPAYLWILPATAPYEETFDLRPNTYVLAKDVTFLLKPLVVAAPRIQAEYNDVRPIVWEGGTIDGGNRNDNKDAIGCDNGARLEFHGVTVKNTSTALTLNFNDARATHSCAVKIVDSTFEDNNTAIAVANSGTATVLAERNVFRNNIERVLSGAQVKARLQNNLFIANGADYSGLVDIGGNNELFFLYNTVASNFTATESVFQCGTVTGAIAGNIIWNLQKEAGVIGSCSGVTVVNNIIEPTNWETTFPEGNFTDMPKFANEIDGDYRLSSDSPALDKGDPAFAPSYDFDGKARPLGNAPDLGAFERTP